MCLFLLPLAIWLISCATPPTGGLWVTLTDAASGREIACGLLGEGDHLVLNWTNSLFGLRVTEVMVARDGTLVLTEIAFGVPGGEEPPVVGPDDVDDLYHTGNPFRARGLSRPVSRVIFRVGEIGNPEVRFGGRVVRLAPEVGFGGGVLMETREVTPKPDRWVAAP